ncbi:hypothetical protein [Clostridium tagluense]|uniref:Uncharacterized protein n=1 Tax=Clostridium tagluense TaxID=360422 RepID=A0A401UTN7_9CLOT|nr:hypothetical protein [Clostridium tagluense]GCD12920.1 hypothetical protein Ctaglu_45430 [Clostridium tagluense]
MKKEKCKYCTGRWDERKPLMRNSKGDYYVKINNCMYLEDSEIGNSNFKFSLIGERIKFCPMCGEILK